MSQKTNLRALRFRYGISLPELSAVSGLSNQYISRAELGETSPTARLEEQLGTALDAVIARRGTKLELLKRSYAARKGRLLQPEEVDLDE